MCRAHESWRQTLKAACQLHVTVFLPKKGPHGYVILPPTTYLYLVSLHRPSLMDSRGDQRPPRSTRPGQANSFQPASPAPAYPDSAPYTRPPLSSTESSKANVSFQNVEKGDRNDHLDPHRQRTLPSAYHPQLTDPEYSDQFDPSRVARKKSLVKPDREKIDQNHRQWHYRSHVAQLEEEGNTRVGVLPSSTPTYQLCFSRTLVDTSFSPYFLSAVI
jgi:chitin synthase